MNGKEEIISKIYQIRGRKVMIDSDLAHLFGVSTSRLNQQVRRNIRRFPSDFMFELTLEEHRNLMLHFATSSTSSGAVSVGSRQSNKPIGTWGGKRKPSLVFTEHGALMLANVLNSPNAVQAGIFIVRAFVRLRELLSLHRELAERLDELERKTIERLDEHSEQLIAVFQALRDLVREKDEPRNPVGFQIGKTAEDIQSNSSA